MSSLAVRCPFALRFLPLILLVCNGRADESAETNLPPVIVTAQRVPSLWREQAAAGAVSAALESEPGVRLNTQGGPSIQSDLSIRGSSFSGAGLAVNGLALRNPQTEHFNAELPLPAALFGAPAVLTGAEQSLAADPHLTGTANLDFLPMPRNAELGAGFGDKSRGWQNVIWQLPLTTDVSVGQWGLAVFGSREEADALGFPDNDLSRLSGGAHLQRISPGTQTDLAIAHARKEFGARGYYGVTPDWFADETTDDSLLFFGTLRGDPLDRYIRISAAWRALKDEYRLFWTQPGIYENRHRSTVRSAFADGRGALFRDATLLWRAGVEHEQLRSNRLGNHDRRRGALTLMPEWRRGRLNLAGGARGEAFSGDEPAMLPQAQIEWKARSVASAYVSYSSGVRQPSYTELNYDSPGSLGNRGLERQETRDLEAGLKGRLDPCLEWRVAAFRSRSEHTVDWVKSAPTSPRWEAADLGRVISRGVEAETVFSATHFDLRAAYTLLSRSHASDAFAGRYVLDYPEHCLSVGGAWRIGAAWRLLYTQTLRWQAEDGGRTDGRFGAPAGLSLRFAPSGPDRIELAVFLDNLWNDGFETFPGQPVAGRRASVGMTVRL